MGKATTREPKTNDEGPVVEEALEHLRRVGLLPEPQEVLDAYVILSHEDRKARSRIGHTPSPPEQDPNPNSMTYRSDGRPQPRVDNRLAIAEQKLQTEVEITRSSGWIALFAQNKRWAMWCRLVLQGPSGALSAGTLGSILFLLALSTAGLLFGGVGEAYAMLLCASLTAAILVPAVIIEALHDREHKRCGGTIGY